MTKQEKQLWLEAIEKLKGHYKKSSLSPEGLPVSYYNATSKNCPLCVAAGLDCNNCLWVKFESAPCLYNLFNLDTTQERLDRLDRWEKKLKDIK